ncbi:DUF3224 domain-containing protein [Bdellovibrio sp. HCB2-146]|uniref:DUF3224 domain-containing protein n=1 Tax=Bdellovibrio sp. HCB2-146 TaxID=3394362 RepID=UPI0039BD0CD3
MKTIKGKFEIKSSPATTDDNIKKMGGMGMSFDKVFSGSLRANSKVSMFGIMNKELGSGGYIAFELVEGEIEDKKGTFVLQHSCFMSKGKQEQSIQVVPDTGTGGLSGLAGSMKIEIIDGQHFYHFEYSL